ncbi:MAG TPA: transporter substrate-binding domain-containing protein [Rudaea sp.]
MRRILSLLALLLLAANVWAQNAELTAAQRQWVATHKVVRVAPDPDFAPIDGVDGEGRERGLAADYLKLIAARTGLEFRVVRVATRSDGMRALRERRADLLPSGGVTDNDRDVIYSKPYLRLAAAIFARAGEPGFATLGQLAGHLVTVVEASPWPTLIAAAGGTAKLQKDIDIAAALKRLREKGADAYIGDPFTAADAIARLKLDKDIVLSGQSGVEAAVGFAVRSDWPQLQEILDAALKSISTDEDKALRERWLKNATAPAAAAAQAPALPASNAAAIDAALQAAAKARGLNADIRQQVDDLLHQAQADETSADQLSAQGQTLSQTSAGADTAAQRLEESLAITDTGAVLAWRAALPDRASAAQLEPLLAAARDNLSAARATVASLQAELDRQTLRPAQLRDEIAAAQVALDQSGVAAAAGADGALAQAQELRNRSTSRLAATRIAVLQLESRTYESRMRLLGAQLRDRQRAVSELKQRESALESLVLDRAGAAVAELQLRVTHERDQAIAQFRMLNDAASANVALVKQLSDSVHSVNALRAQKQDWDNWLRDTTQALKNTEERIQIGGVSEAVGLILLAEKSRLKPLPLLRRTLASLQTDLAQTRIGLIDVREQSEALADLGDAVGQELGRLPEPPADRLNDLRTAMYRLLSTRAEILPSLLSRQTRLATADADAERVLRELVAATEKLEGLLDARLLWTPSHKAVDLAWFERIAPDAGAFFNPRRWSHVAANLANSLAAAPLPTIAGLAAFLLLLLGRRRAPARLQRIAVPMRRIRTDRYRLTGAALAWTLIAALPPAAFLWLLGYFCRQVPAGNGNLTEEAGYALATTVPAALALTFLRALMYEDGLAQFHFRWPRPRREALRDAVPWLAVCVLPAQFVLSLIMLRGDAAPIDTLGRLLLAIALLGSATTVWRLFAPGRVWTLRGTTLAEPLRLRQTVRVAVTGFGVILAALVLRGYFVTGVTLSGRAIASCCAALVVATAHGLAVRWLVLGERRLALKRMQKKQEAEAEQRETGEGEDLPDPEPEEITLASVSAQTRNFLRTLTMLALIAVLLWIWSDVTPAVTLLDTVPVWKDQNVTLLGLLEALVVLGLTWVATRNLPGLLEIGLLRRIHIDAATRYAITSVTRYLIVFAGTIAGLSLLGLHWSSLQWLAAGFSVGLGFGMQEIFANFISGLMVLFERPIRVGDTITIGNVEGTVTRIRTRATTIVDGDNREVIVPNKSFITDRLINWTLSDSVTRVAIKVGVAYRNDPREAQRLLLEIAAAHPQVLADPAPACWMSGFGDSSQDFDLRVCVAEIAQRNPVRTDLQMRIADVFREHDIEIAFPQMDLWLRNEVQLKAAPPPADASPPAPRTAPT